MNNVDKNKPIQHKTYIKIKDLKRSPKGMHRNVRPYRRDPHKNKHSGQNNAFADYKRLMNTFSNQVRIWGSLFVSKYTIFSLSDIVDKCGVLYDLLKYKSLHSAWLMIPFVTKWSSFSTTLLTRHRRRSRGNFGFWQHPHSIAKACELQDWCPANWW